VASLGETFGSVHVVGDSGDGYTERRRVEESLCRFAPRVAMVQTTQGFRPVAVKKVMTSSSNFESRSRMT
jgi:hypothetical protein